MTNTEILEVGFNEIKDEIISIYDSRGRRASGRFADEMEVQAEGLTVRLLGVEYTEYTVDGRGPGKPPPTQVIEEWIVNKSFTAIIENEITTSSLAFLIARKIAREGTEIFKEGGSDIIESVITPQRIQELIDRVSVFNVSEFTSRFVSLFQELAA